ncbi:hypothetical protein NM680_15120 [Paracoccus sp. PS-1]|uniref:hypothetical protein n=1 Tax=Paracoccus sp. PS1 TaxID=2963938 RepID=UPI0027E4D122|nr:hypothetical protein [Paracoccus sp. PS1]MDQ7263125.1 hypothetical protein [Paracoccus sp. PS1]
MSALRKPAAPEPAPREPARARPRWKVVVAPPRTEAAEAPDHIPLERLRQAAAPGLHRADLPFRPALEAMFGPLPPVQVLTGAPVEAALDRKGAEAAAQDGVLFLRRDAALPVVAHELAHVLQSRAPRQDAKTSPEAEAQRVELQARLGAPPPPVAARLAPGTIAFRMQGAQDPVPQPDPPVAVPPQPAPEQPAPPLAEHVPPSTQPAADAPEAVAPEQLGPAPEPDLGAETEAAAAEAEAASAALEAAQDADAVMAAFAAAPPSVKAREAAGLGARIEAASARARAAEDAALPELRAEMAPGEPLPAAPPVTTPAATAGALEAQTPPPAPLPDLAPTPDPGQAAANASLGPLFERDFTAGDPQSLERSFDRVQTRDGQVATSAGARPDVPLAGETDPARVADQEAAAGTQATEAGTAAARAVIDGPGPEQAQLREMSESSALPPRPAPEPAPALPPVEGAAAFAAQPLDATTVALFDRAHGPAMQESLGQAQADLDAAAQSREAGREAELAHAEAEQARLNAEADHAQRDEVIARRADIQSARQDALDQQAGHVSDLRDEAASARSEARGEVDAEVGRVETRIDADFVQAEREAEAEVAQGETRAQASRDEAERESENQSWWDRAVNWVKAQLERLTAAINAIFDAVRTAVRDIIKAVKSAALGLIDAAAGLIKGIIEAFGALLKTLVNRLLAEYFPAIAAALNAAIDAAVTAATAAIDRIANALKAGIEFLMNALAAGLDALLAAWQAAVNAALALAQAALSGDWAALARLILSPILMALGIQPDAFFQLFARAAQAIDLIVANPGGFVQNLLEAVKGGIQRFADNFRRHLIAGIILWLTGPLGRGITMPAEFDLWGLLDVARQALGLTLETVRRVAVRVLGESAVQKIEYVLSYVRALITGGWQGLWEQLTSDLAMLRDMVLDQLKTFLLEKVVLASIMWLAGMFNPVGALVKLVMTIWNFIQFLRTQLARIFAVVQTVINTIWEIATGALEPPMRGVEQVLARLLPVVLDLLARLIGVSGIPEKVQEVLRAVRLKIETALENLMRRVLAAFGIEGRQAETPAAGQIMAPIHFRAGSEAHTLLIEDEGETVRPVIRSDPTPLVQWLDGRLGQPFTDYAAQKNWRGVVLANKRAELEALVAAAKAEEAQLDAQAELTEDAVNAAQAEGASEAVKAEAAAKAQETQAKGEQTKSAVARVLEFFGISIVPLDQKFAPELEAMAPSLSENLRRYVLPNLDVARYTPLDWRGFATMLAGDGSATEPWRRPANATGAARRFTGGGFDASVSAEARRLAKALSLPNADTFLGTEPAFDPARVGQLFGDHLTRRLNEGGATLAITDQLLAGGGPDYPALMTALATPLSEAVTAMCSAGTDSHDHAFERVTGSYFRTVIVDQFDSVMTQGGWGTYYQDDAMNAAGSGEGGVTKPLGHFVRPDPTGKAGSKRAARNGQRLADAVRGADPGQHEWIASRFAAQIIRNAADDVERGETERLRGLCELIQFQHRVRTPTRQLIFAPQGPYPAQKVVISYQAYGHRMDPEWKDTPEDRLPEARRAEWYPPGSPHQGARIGIMQGHPGAIYARVSGGVPSPEIKQQTAGHGTWDQALEGIVARDLSDGTVYFSEMHQMAENIVRFFRLTVWNGETLPEGGSAYGEYFNSGQQAESLSALAAEYRGYFPNFEATLQAQIDQVRSA